MDERAMSDEREIRGASAAADQPSDFAGGAGNGSLPPPFQHLAIPVPPMLEEAIGYNGDQRFVAFYWSPGGDEACWDDGRRSATGEWAPYLLFVRHAAVWPHLLAFDFGSSDAPAQHYLVLDRSQRVLYAAPARAAGILLREQWPAVTAEERAALPHIEVEDLMAHLRTVIQHMEAVEARLTQGERQARLDALIARQRQRDGALGAWLDAWLAMHPSAGGTSNDSHDEGRADVRER